MSKPIIAVDIDDVLGMENEAMRLFINEVYGQNFTEADFRVTAPYWGYWESIQGIDQIEGEKRHKAFMKSSQKANTRVLDGAIDALNKLKQNYDLVIVTARDNSLLDITHAWLEKHFPETFTRVEFVHVWTGDNKASKAIICKEIKASYLIDDNLDHCLESAEAGLEALLFGDYGWNRRTEALPGGVTRVTGWQQVLDYFDARG